MMYYEPLLALQAIDLNAPLILLCLAGALGFSFVYFIIGIRMAIRQKVYVEPFHHRVLVDAVPHRNMLRRRSNAGQSVWMNLSVVILFSCVSAAFMIAAPAFRSPIYLAVYAVFVCWPLFNIWMIRRMPSEPAYPEPKPISFAKRTGWRLARA